MSCPLSHQDAMGKCNFQAAIQYVCVIRWICVCSLTDCAGCGRDIKNGQALLALDRQWHLGCFKCKACGKVLSGEYISK